jgi:hypothetical protein
MVPSRGGTIVNFGAYDQYAFAFAAALGTVLAAGALLWWTNRPINAKLRQSLLGVVPQFPSLIGVLFGLNLAFLANDTWNAHDRATEAVFHEADSLRSLKVVATNLPESIRSHVESAIDDYTREIVLVEWPLLGRRQSSAVAGTHLDGLLTFLTRTEVTAAISSSTDSFLLQQLNEVRRARDLRISLSQTHVNPLKWLGMAFLGFLTMLSIAVVHLEVPRAEILAVLLFAAAAAPSAALLLILGNPYQEPVSVTAQPIAQLLPVRP